MMFFAEIIAVRALILSTGDGISGAMLDAYKGSFVATSAVRVVVRVFTVKAMSVSVLHVQSICTNNMLRCVWGSSLSLKCSPR